MLMDGGGGGFNVVVGRRGGPREWLAVVWGSGGGWR